MNIIEKWKKIGRVIIKIMNSEGINEREVKLMNKGKRGGRYKYSNTYIFLLFTLYKLEENKSLRGIEGYLLGLKVIAPDYTTLSRRFRKIGLNKVYRRVSNRIVEEVSKDKEVILIVDGTGLRKNSNYRRMYRISKYGIREEKIKNDKIIVGINSNSIPLFIIRESSESKGAIKGIEAIINNGKIKIKEIIGDGAYDSKEIYEICKRYKIKPIIRIRKNAIAKSKSSSIRKRIILDIANKYENKVNPYSISKKYKLRSNSNRIRISKEAINLWLKDNNYYRRERVEGVIYAIKRYVGEEIKLRKEEGINNEIKMIYILMAYLFCPNIDIDYLISSISILDNHYQKTSNFKSSLFNFKQPTYN